jgi:hypothetical protein
VNDFVRTVCVPALFPVRTSGPKRSVAEAGAEKEEKKRIPDNVVTTSAEGESPMCLTHINHSLTT